MTDTPGGWSMYFHYFLKTIWRFRCHCEKVFLIKKTHKSLTSNLCHSGPFQQIPLLAWCRSCLSHSFEWLSNDCYTPCADHPPTSDADIQHRHEHPVTQVQRLSKSLSPSNQGLVEQVKFPYLQVCPRLPQDVFRNRYRSLKSWK